MSATYVWRVVCFCFHPHSAERGNAVESTDYLVSPVDPQAQRRVVRGVRIQQIRVGDRDQGSGSNPGTGLMQLEAELQRFGRDDRWAGGSGQPPEPGSSVSTVSWTVVEDTDADAVRSGGLVT